jgi:hypothetical protein
MSSAGRLNDNEVAQEMNKMVAFIKQEALEKARETKIKVEISSVSSAVARVVGSWPQAFLMANWSSMMTFVVEYSIHLIHSNIMSG